MEPDGNCFFRAISYELFGTQDEHGLIRTILYRMENLNKEVFSRFLFSGNTIEEHIKTISTPHSWATQVEVVAAASVFQVPVYYFSRTTMAWNIVNPFGTNSVSQTTLRLPVLPPPDSCLTRLKPTHFELLYYENCHYDAIVSATTGRVSASPPPLTSSHTDFIDLTSNSAS